MHNKRICINTTLQSQPGGDVLIRNSYYSKIGPKSKELWCSMLIVLEILLESTVLKLFI